MKSIDAPINEKIFAFVRDYPFDKQWDEEPFTNGLCLELGAESQKPYPKGAYMGPKREARCDAFFANTKHWLEVKFSWSYGDYFGKKRNGNFSKHLGLKQYPTEDSALRDVKDRLGSLKEHQSASNIGMLIVSFDAPLFPFDEQAIREFEELASFREEGWKRFVDVSWPYPGYDWGTIRTHLWLLSIKDSGNR